MANQTRKPRRNSRNDGKGRKPMRTGTGNKNQRRDEEMVDTALKQYKSTSNPYAWYANFPNYAKDVATIAFGLPLGQPLNIGRGDVITAGGVMNLWFCPSIGYSSDLTSPINRQATRFYTYLRSIQRAASSYDSADVMMYMIAMDSLYTYWAYLRRAYGVAQLFTPTNKYYPRRLLQAMGIDPSIANNLADFRAFINRFALNIGRFAMPKNFDIIQRHMWMTSGLYVDSQTTRAQTYMFTPSILFKYNNTVTTGSQLEGQALASFTTTPVSRDLTSLIAYANILLNAVENDEDTMNISGDIYRAYGPGGLMTVEETPDNYAIVPIYDETVLSQIENAVIAGYPAATTSSSELTMPVITQDPSVNGGAIIFTPTVRSRPTVIGSNAGANIPVLYDKSVINMHMDSPTPEQVMEATRLVVSANTTASLIGAGDTSVALTACGTDIINYVEIAVFNPDNPAAVRLLNFNTNTIWYELSTGTIANTAGFDLMGIINQFDWAPMLYLASYSGTTGNVTQIEADIDNITALSYQQLGYIHEAALLSVLDIQAPDASR